MMHSGKLRRLVASLSCMCCGMGIKASDAALMALCVRCHAELDQGQTMTKEERRAAQYEWMAKTWVMLAEQGKIAV
ncbi:conserved exported hypothetical protein [Candidatus Glomeribacter gigasporarum BEG34]|uniref:Uncharacterized protein n=1 Tax=Candidatus Glomeribacter gigasporarum BEG34 TaxID=1070319 RepID=G2J7U1_9BURK|nr:hypothetical protein [Candidatus Glomeribacter gigasporarum]CCD28836.1 conserved exported hypothetical protein [Candidatus Glomeribacter gigasporarum BEG34]